MAIDKKKFLADQKWKADLLINSNKDTNIAGRREDANSWLRNWRYERGIPVDSGVMPSKDEVPIFLRPWLFPKADASPRDGMKIANFLTPSGSGRTLSEEAYWDGYNTIMDTTTDGSDEQIKRLNILWHQFNDQVSNPADGLKIGQFIGPRVDTHLPSGGPGSLLDRRDTDFIRQQREQHERRPGRGYESDIEYGVFKKKKKSQKRTA